MNPRSDFNSSGTNAPDTSLAATRRDSSLAAVSSVPSSSFADDTRHGQTDVGQMDVEQDEHLHPARNGALWLLLSLLAFYSVFSLGAWSAKRSSQPPAIGPFASHAKTAEARVVVHVAGAVQHPGAYTLNSNARIFEALEKAGGALPQAETDALNLADWAQDGARIEVPFKAKTGRASTASTTPNATMQAAIETAPAATTSATSAESDAATTDTATANVASDESSIDTSQSAAAQSAATTTQTTTPAPIPAPSSTRLPRETTAKARKPRSAKAKAQSKTVAGLPRAVTPDGKLSDNASPQYLAQHPLDLNKITRQQLEALPGVGPSLAQKILDYRAQNSGFKNVEELDNVSGIGAKKLAALKPLLYVVGAPSEASQTPATSP